MEIIRDPREMQRRAGDWRRAGRSIGLAPTMGAFHEGHLSLMRAAVRDNDVAVVSLYVNPIQFGPQEDLEQYPRALERDRALAEREAVDVLFHPSDDSMYPAGYQTYVEVGEVARGLCGDRRPGHFRGVATIVARLFHLVQPHRAYFGEKDFQQLRVVERVVHDLNMEVRVVPMPMVREPDGLAMSSRNAYLSPEQRRAATVLYRGLRAAREWVSQGEKDPARIRARLTAMIAAEPLARADYVEIVDAASLRPVAEIGPGARLLLAAYVGAVRLIDNGPLLD